MSEKEADFIPNTKNSLSKKEITIDGKLYVRPEFMPGIEIGESIYELPAYQELLKEGEKDNWTTEDYENELMDLKCQLLGAKNFLRTIKLFKNTEKTEPGEWPIVSTELLDIYKTDTKNEFVIVYRGFETKRGVKGRFNKSSTWVLRVKKEELLNHFLPKELHENKEIFKKGNDIKYIDPKSSYLEYFL